MYDTMVAAALSNASFVVVDRPNPITGMNAFGPVLNQSYASYVGRRPIAQAHGMTTGELAKMFVGEGWIEEAANGSALSLDVIAMEGWNRSMAWKDTGLPWVMPSPSAYHPSLCGTPSERQLIIVIDMPTPDTALVYPGACMFEGTSLSEGRGTTHPFELIGAPYTNDTWTTLMRGLNVTYTSFRTACFSPTTSKFISQTSCGLQSYISLQSAQDYGDFDPVYLGVALLWSAKNLFTADGNTSGVGNTTESFHWLFSGASTTLYDIDVLSGGPLIREGIEGGLTPREIKSGWEAGLEDFKTKRKGYLLY